MAKKVCPLWVGYLLSCPMRKLILNPEKALGPYIEAGMKILDIGCAMGYFSLPLARMAGSKGKVICVDVQEGMIRSLKKRARKAGVSHQIDTRLCGQDSLGLDDLKGEIDFALAAAVVHEVPDASTFFYEIHETMNRHGKFLVLEPKGHVSGKKFEITVSVAEQNGFKPIDRPRIGRSHTVLLKKK